MNTKYEKSRDAFTFSLGGLSIRSSFVPMPAIADDRYDRAREADPKPSQEDQPDTDKEMKLFWGRFWLRARRRAA